MLDKSGNRCLIIQSEFKVFFQDMATYFSTKLVGWRLAVILDWDSYMAASLTVNRDSRNFR
jgi:hypothetical protein